MSDHYDVIVIGSGPGGGSVAHRLAPTGKRILLLERGDYLPRSPANWDSQTVFVDGAYQAPETWYGADGRSFHPGLHYYVGGNSKVYGAALFRMRERDFDEIVHKDGLSPAWPLKYDAFEPYYAEAERLFHVHGQRGEDPTEPPSSGPFPHPPVSHEPRIAGAWREPGQRRPASVSSAAGNPARREGRQADADQHLHPLRRLRRLSLPAERQGRRAGHLRRSGVEGAIRI